MASLRRSAPGRFRKPMARVFLQLMIVMLLFPALSGAAATAPTQVRLGGSRRRVLAIWPLGKQQRARRFTV